MVIVQCVVNGFSVPAEPHELGILEDPELVAHRGLAQLMRVESPNTRNRSASSYNTSSSGSATACGCAAGRASFASAISASPFAVDSYECLFMCSWYHAEQPLSRLFAKIFAPKSKILNFTAIRKKIAFLICKRGAFLETKNAASQSGERFGTRVFKIWIYHFRRAAATHGRYISASAAAMAGRKPRI